MPAEHLLFRCLVKLEKTPVGEADAVIPVFHEHQGRRIVEKRPCPAFAFRQRRLYLLAVADIGGNRADYMFAASGIENREFLCHVGARDAVRMHKLFFHGLSRSGPQDPVFVLLPLFGLRVAEDFRIPSSDDVIRLKTMGFAIFPVRDQHGSVGSLRKNHRLGVFNQRVETCFRRFQPFVGFKPVQLQRDPGGDPAQIDNGFLRERVRCHAAQVQCAEATVPDHQRQDGRGPVSVLPWRCRPGVSFSGTIRIVDDNGIAGNVAVAQL